MVIEPGEIATAFGDNVRRFGGDTAPWDELRAEWDRASGLLGGGEPPRDELVATAIAEAVEADDPPLQHPRRRRRRARPPVRSANDDAAFEATMRATLGLTW